MKAVIAIDSFKGSMSSIEAGNAAAEGIRRVYPDADIKVLPLADGGEGTVDALTAGMGGIRQQVTVTGPLGEPVVCEYGMIADAQAGVKTAVMEMAAAAGITLVEPAKRNLLQTTTYGVGEMIKDAIMKGCRRFIIGIGGSATNDGGAGMLQALGYGLLDESGEQIPHGAQGLSRLVRITDENALSELAECTFQIACDVTNPLCGPMGASAVFGPQKGATPEMVVQMDGWLEGYAALAAKWQLETSGRGGLGRALPGGNTRFLADANYPGTGAAGGLGFAFRTFTNAVLKPGIQIVLDEIRLEDDVQTADVVITGEGRLDGQTVMGKAPIGVAAVAKKYGCTVLAFAGCVTPDASICNEHGIDAFFPILRNVVSLEEAMEPESAKRNMAAAVEQVFRLYAACGK